MALVTTSLDGPVSSWWSKLFQADMQDCSTCTGRFSKQFDSVTVQYKAQVEAQNAKLNKIESVFIYACRVEDLANKSGPDDDATMRTREYLKVFIPGVTFKLKRLGNEEELDQNPTPEEPVFLLKFSKNGSIENTLLLK